MTQVFLVGSPGSGVVLTPFPDPGNWNPVNTVEVIAPGVPGSAGNTNVGYGGPGGAGGNYAVGHNLQLTFPVNYAISAPPLAGGGLLNGFNVNQTAVISSDPGPNVVAVGIAFNSSGNGAGNPGNVLNSWPQAGNALGGKGGDGSLSFAGGGGGGGAGGPRGAGAPGTMVGSAGIGGPGGAANGGTVPGGAQGTSGSSDQTWDASHGVGSGGGGSPNSTTVPGAGGAFGGGGGGGYAANGTGKNGAAGTSGIIVITYTPLLPNNLFAQMIV